MKNIYTKINWFGLAGGITTILVIIVSMFIPWWQLTVGEDLLKANVSPVNTNFVFLDASLTVPFILALNIVSTLTLLASGIAMLFYSIIPTKPYSKHLLSFAYKKPVYTFLFFVITLFALTLIAQTMFSFNVPLNGSATITLPTAMTQNITISVHLSASVQWPFWLAAAAAGLCIATRIYHKRVALDHNPTTATTET